MSESLKMYSSTIMRLRQSRVEPVPLSSLADALSIASVSANEMFRKLQEQGLVVYRPYKGVTLTESGERQGRRAAPSGALDCVPDTKTGYRP